MFNLIVTALKIALLVGLYIFLMITLRTIYLDMRTKSEQRSPRLVALKGSLARGSIYPLTGELTIGREVEAGISISDPYISTLHAKIVPFEGGFGVEDLGSRNGTLLNNGSVEERKKLKPGDRIKLGDTIFQYME